MRPDHIRAIAEGEIAGLSRREIASKTGLTPRTISRYRRRPEVLAAVEQLRRLPRSERAQDVLVGLLASDSETIRLQAALGIVRYGVQRVRPEAEPVEPPAAPPGFVLVRKDPLT
jgi:transcriptional regulator with XRE-family HTH domain